MLEWSRYNLYDLVEVGGYVVVDDYGWNWGGKQGGQQRGSGMWGAKDAVLDFREVHGIGSDAAHAVRDIDMVGAYWVKATEVELRRESYLPHGAVQKPLQRLVSASCFLVVLPACRGPGELLSCPVSCLRYHTQALPELDLPEPARRRCLPCAQPAPHEERLL